MATSSEIIYDEKAKVKKVRDVAIGLGSVFFVSAAMTAGAWAGMSVAAYLIRKGADHLIQRSENKKSKE